MRIALQILPIGPRGRGCVTEGVMPVNFVSQTKCTQLEKTETAQFPSSTLSSFMITKDELLTALYRFFQKIKGNETDYFIL